MIHVRHCPRGDAAYAAFAASAPEATVYHDPRWLDAVEDAFGLPCFRLLAERDGQPVGMLPLAHVKSVLFGRFLLSTPFGNFGGIVTTDQAARQPLLDSAVQLARQRGARWIEFRHIDAMPLDLVAQTRKVTQTLTLTADPDELWKALPAKVRNQVRKAEKSGLTAAIVGREGLDDFYRIFARNLRDLGTPVYSRRFFDVLWNHMGDSLRVATVHQGQTLMAAMVLLDFRTQTECPWAGSLREFNDLCPNMLQYWTVIQDACRRGLTLFDFGTSDVDGGVYRFKKQWGAVEKPLHRQYWLAPGQELPHLNPNNPRYAAKIRMWQKLPVWLTKIIGPPLARKLP